MTIIYLMRLVSFIDNIITIRKEKISFIDNKFQLEKRKYAKN